jgi:hypothetical protein
MNLNFATVIYTILHYASIFHKKIAALSGVCLSRWDVRVCGDEPPARQNHHEDRANWHSLGPGHLAAGHRPAVLARLSRQGLTELQASELKASVNPMDHSLLMGVMVQPNKLAGFEIGCPDMLGVLESLSVRQRKPLKMISQKTKSCGGVGFALGPALKRAD